MMIMIVMKNKYILFKAEQPNLALAVKKSKTSRNANTIYMNADYALGV